MIEELFEGCLSIDPSQQTAEDFMGPSSPIPTSKGIILFADDSERPIQLVTAANIRRTVIARLFGYDLSKITKRTNIAQITHKICYYRCYNDFKISLKYYQIARALYPNSYKEILTLPKQAYIKIDPTAKWPFFSLIDKPMKLDTEKIFGLFPSRKAAGQFIQILQSAFDLCQRPGLINAGQKAQSCPYLQMSNCPAPCVGRTSRTEYLKQVESAILAAQGNLDESKNRLQNCMLSLSEQRAFEKAQAIKKQLQQLELLAKEAYRWTTELSKLTILHIDMSAKIADKDRRKKIQTYSAFLIRSGTIFELPDFTLEKIEEFHKSLLAQLSLAIDHIEPIQLSEQLSIIGYRLYRSTPAGIWLDCSSIQQPPSAKQIKMSICKKIESTTRNSQNGITNKTAIDDNANC